MAIGSSPAVLAGSDRLIGDEGRDILLGKGGKDVLRGGKRRHLRL